MEHTPTPWYCDGDGVYSNKDCEGAPLAHVLSMGYDNDFRNIDARRIVTCVNMCAGLSTEAMEEITKNDELLKDRVRFLRTGSMRADELQYQRATVRASLFAESQRKQQLEQQVADLVGVLESMPNEVAGCYCTAEAAARAVIQKVMGGE